MASESSKLKLVSTGIDGLDDRLGGGIPDCSIVLILGEPGSGYDLFVQQVLYNKAKEGGRSIYFTVERPPEEVKEDMRIFGLEVDDVERSGNWVFIDSYTPRLEHPSVTETMSILIRSFIPSIDSEKTYTVIDSLSYLLLVYDLRRVVELVDALKRKVKKIGGVHFLLVGRERHDPAALATLSHIVDGVLDFICYESPAREFERMLRIRKMRQVIHDTRFLPVRITKRGISIETIIRVL